MRTFFNSLKFQILSNHIHWSRILRVSEKKGNNTENRRDNIEARRKGFWIFLCGSLSFSVALCVTDKKKQSKKIAKVKRGLNCDFNFFNLILIAIGIVSKIN